MLTRRQLLLSVLLSLIPLWLLIRKVNYGAPSRPISPGAGAKPAFRQRLVAVGDLHGGRCLPHLDSLLSLTCSDVDNARRVLRMAKIIDTESNWIAGSDILVQTGDIVDRGSTALDIYQMMRELRSQAEGAGGQVISILGNHEVMNAIGDWR